MEEAQIRQSCLEIAIRALALTNEADADKIVAMAEKFYGFIKSAQNDVPAKTGA